MERFIILKNLNELVGIVNTHSDIGDKCFCSRQNITNQLKKSNIIKVHNITYLIVDKVIAFDTIYPDVKDYLTNILHL